MIQRDVTAVLLVSSADSVGAIDRTVRAVRQQSRPADRTVLVAAAGLSESVAEYLGTLQTDGMVDDRINLSPGATMAGATRAVVSRIAGREAGGRRPDNADHAAQDADAQGAAVAPDGARAAEPSGRADAHTGGSTAVSPQHRGRRARSVDTEAELARSTREAQEEARVPARLRQRGSARGGRRRRATADDQSWLWLLTMEAEPDQHALEELVRTVREVPSTAVAGSKHLSANSRSDAPPLVDLGITLTHSHRIRTSVDAGEIDQGQADWRTDVLGVTLPSMLVQTAALQDVGGFDPALASPWAELDLCQRIWRSGERVTAVSDSRVSADPSRLTGAKDPVAFRSGQVLSLIRQRPTLMGILTLLVLPFALIARIIGAIVSHRPRAVGHELQAFVRILRHAPAVFARGRASSARSPIPRRRLAPLYVPRSAAARLALDEVWTDLFADDAHTRRIKRTTWGIAGTSHGADDADYGRHTVWTLVLAGLSAAIALLAMRSILGRGSLVGPHLIAPTNVLQDRWDTVFSSWIPGELGAPGPSDALTRLVGMIPLSGDAIVLTLQLLAIPAAALGAWFAAGTLSRSIVVRLIAAVAWTTAPPLADALLSGRWPAVLVHLMIPLAAIGLVRAIGLPHKTAQASPAAAAAGGLALAVISAVQPILAPMAFIGLLFIIPFIPSRRWRMVWFAVPVLGLHLPNLTAYIQHPKSLIAVSGVEGAFARPSLADLALLQPTAHGRLAEAAGADGSLLWALFAASLMIAGLLALLTAPFLAGDAGRVGIFSVLVVAGGFALALALGRFVTGFDDGTPFTSYAGPALSIVCAGLVTALLCTGDAIAHRVASPVAGQTWLRRTLAPVLGILAVGLVASWAIMAPSAMELERTTELQIPAVAADQGVSDQRTRTLVLHQENDGSVTGRVVDGAGDSIDQSSGAENARQAELGETASPFDTASEHLVGSIAANLADDGTGVVPPLSTFAVQYVVVPSQENADSITLALNSSPRFERVTESDQGGLWRVVDPSARAMILDSAPGQRINPTTTTALPSGRTDAQAQVKAADHVRTVMLSERSDSGWHATLNGRALTPVVVDDWAQGFELPAGASGELHIRYTSPLATPLIIIGLIILAVTVLVALPWRRRSKEAL
ncbi:glycosyltransferase family 2 protein [Helcobacillus massiliensis]|uniref:Glycosyltransferase n=1 Tax=Helcobacillus massiliensis TaxID=521392 RepID=A0A839R0R8_9MICO|nr:hypothetical protein [Helcobacillus massiliensis]MBB3021976.1 hypothetical protein [Helcobacillus massiliensis]